jgi:hypothetical protein
MNSNLYGKVWDFPQEMRNHMKVCFTKVNNADANTEGFNRNKRLQSASSIGYSELKRIKNFFDNHSGTNTDAPFILNGENKMKNFVDSILSGARQSIATTQKIKNQTGSPDKNDLKDLTSLQNMNISQDNKKKKSIEKYDLQVTENLKRINDLIKQII